MEGENGILYQQILHQEQQDAVQLALSWLMDRGWNGPVESLPHIGEVLLTEPDRGRLKEGTLVSAEFLGMPNTMKSEIGEALGRLYRRNITYWPPLVALSDRMAEISYGTLGTFGGHERSLYEEITAAEADLFFAYLRLHLNIDPDPSISIDHSDHALITTCLQIMKSIVEDLEEGTGYLAQFRRERGIPIPDEGSPLRKIIQLLGALRIDLSTISIDDQYYLYTLFGMILYEVDFEPFVELGRKLFVRQDRMKHSLSVRVHRPLIYEASTRETLFIKAVFGSDLPNISIFDEGLSSACLYLIAQFAFGRIPYFTGIANTLTELEIFLRFKEQLAEKVCLSAFFLFFVEPEKSLGREGGRRGPIMRLDFLEVLWRQLLRFYHNLLTRPNRGFAVVPIDASGTPRDTVHQVCRALNSISKYVGMDFRIPKCNELD